MSSQTNVAPVIILTNNITINVYKYTFKQTKFILWIILFKLTIANKIKGRDKSTVRWPGLCVH